ncbi:FAD binding domain-containing protein [Candidatus Bipolaricaulota bacterium]|nr:FAD binding domain-containing protein [Candidatus Bipolaricaulota bacterium]
MLSNVTKYHIPGSLGEALSLHNRESRSYFLAGGTGLALSDSNRPVELIDLDDLELDELEVDREAGRLLIGATRKIQQVVGCPDLEGFADGYLQDGLEKVGSYPIRNAGTLGGSIVRPFPWSDVIPILLALDATILYFDRSHEKRELSRLYDDDFRPTLRNAIVTGIEVSLPDEGVTRGSFQKFSRSEFDVASLNVGCTITERDGEIVKARMAVGARPSFATRLTEVEESLKGRSLNEDLIYETAELASQTAAVSSDRKMSKEYRVAQVRKMAEDALRDITSEFN